MAIQVAPVYLSDYRIKRKGLEPRWRLGRHHIDDLRDVARGVEESNVGVCCRYLIDHLTSIGDSDIDEDGYINRLDPIENFCEKFNVWEHPAIITWRRRIARCRRAVNRMRQSGQNDEASILFIVFGYPDPSVRELPKKVLDSLGELAPLARYTDRVEEQRKELAKQEAVRISGIQNPIEPPSNWMEGVLRFQAEEDERRARAVRRGLRPEYGPILVDLMRHRDKYEWALRTTSSGEALRSLFSSVSPRIEPESKEHFEIRKQNHEAKQDVVLTDIKVQVTKMFKDASLAYHKSWLASA